MGFGRWIAAGAGLATIGGVVAFAQYRDTEKPAYDVLLADGKFELRQYAPMIVAEVTHTGERQRAQGASFRRLAAYIFAQDRPGSAQNADEKIAMTAPVMQEETSHQEWRMRFVMPAKFTMETLPEPPSDITLQEVPRRRMAAVRFSGNATDSDLIVMEADLADWLERQGLKAAGPFEYAFYDAPMVPGPLRRNEVLVEVAAE